MFATETDEFRVWTNCEKQAMQYVFPVIAEDGTFWLPLILCQ